MQKITKNCTLNYVAYQTINGQTKVLRKDPSEARLKKWAAVRNLPIKPLYQIKKARFAQACQQNDGSLEKLKAECAQLNRELSAEK